MARIRKPSGTQNLKSGDDFIEKARSGGAIIEPSKKEGFTKVSTRLGSTFITPGDEPLDQRTRKNLRHWFRLLGLLVLIVCCLIMVDFLWGFAGLPPIA